MALFIVTLLITEFAAIYFYTALAMHDFEFLSHAVLRPRNSDKGAYNVEPVPGLKKQTLFIACGDGSKMHAWYFKKPGSDKIVIVNHGAGGNILSRTYIANSAALENYSTLLYDYRGYALSTGKYNLDTILEDGLTVYDYVHKNLGYPGENIVECGESIGTAVASQTAAIRPCAGLIMLSGPTQLPTAIRHIFPLFWIFPDSVVAKNKIDNVKTIQKVKVPVLFIHGKLDQSVPCACSEEMYAAASEPKKLFLLPNNAHDDVSRQDAEQFQIAISEFLSKLNDGKR